MTRVIEGEPKGRGRRFGIVVARFNAIFTEKLLDACVRTLRERGVDDQDITVAYVPGAVELPLACQTMAQSGDVAAVIALGCVIRGDTTHFDYVAGAASQGSTQVSLHTSVPVIFGVLTTENLEQAKVRTEGSDNKGIDAALAALETADLLHQMREGA